MKKKKHFSKVIVTIVMMLIIGLKVNAADFLVDGIKYEIISEDDKTVKVVFNDSYYWGNITIPETVNDKDITYTVTSIGDYAFNSSPA